MRSSRSLALAGSLASLLFLAACGESGSSSGTASTTPPAASSGAGSSSPAASTVACDPVAGNDLVVLEDDKKLQTVDNIIPAINAEAATPALVAALDAASAALTSDKLIALNKQTDLERKSPADAAKAFVTAEGISGGSGGSGNIVVGAANFNENQTLANIYAQVLNSAGFKASVKVSGNRELYEKALEQGDLQVVPEYVGTLTEFLNKKANGANATAQASGELDATVTALTALGAKVGLKFGKPAAAADQNAFAVTTGFAEKYGVSTLSELAAKCSGVSLGGPPECPTRTFCQPGLESKYGLKVSGFTALDAGGPLSKTALKTGKVALSLVFSSDASLVG